jgi:hypothetical protein
VRVSHNNWDQWLPEALFAIRTTPSAGTKFSPFRLLYVRDAIMPIHNALMDPLATQTIDQLENRQDYMDLDHATARANMIAYHARLETQLNASRSPSDLSIGCSAMGFGVTAPVTDLFCHSVFIG